MPAARAVTPPTATTNLFWSVNIARKPPAENMKPYQANFLEG